MMLEKQTQFDPNNLPEIVTAIFNIDGIRIGTFNPHTLIIHPMGDSTYGPMKLLGHMAFDRNGKLIGKFTANGLFSPVTEEDTTS